MTRQRLYSPSNNRLGTEYEQSFRVHLHRGLKQIRELGLSRFCSATIDYLIASLLLLVWVHVLAATVESVLSCVGILAIMLCFPCIVLAQSNVQLGIGRLIQKDGGVYAEDRNEAYGG